MKRFVSDFVHRGLIAAGLGPVVLAVIYLILRQTAGVEALSVKEVCTGIFSVTVLAFAAGGMNAVYQLERIPLMGAILLHGSVLYVCYLGAYLLNGWLKWGSAPILVFTGAFAVGYVLIWAVIYCAVRRNTKKVNRLLKEKQQAL